MSKIVSDDVDPIKCMLITIYGVLITNVWATNGSPSIVRVVDESILGQLRIVAVV